MCGVCGVCRVVMLWCGDVGDGTVWWDGSGVMCGVVVLWCGSVKVWEMGGCGGVGVVCGVGV